MSTRPLTPWISARDSAPGTCLNIVTMTGRMPASRLALHFRMSASPGIVGRIAQLTQAFAPDPIHYDLVLDIEDLALPPGILGQRHLGEDLWLARSDHRGVKDRKVIPL